MLCQVKECLFPVGRISTVWLKAKTALSNYYCTGVSKEFALKLAQTPCSDFHFLICTSVDGCHNMFRAEQWLWRTGHHVMAVTTKEITAAISIWKDRKPPTHGSAVQHQLPSWSVTCFKSVFCRRKFLCSCLLFTLEVPFRGLFWDSIRLCYTCSVQKKEERELLYSKEKVSSATSTQKTSPALRLQWE